MREKVTLDTAVKMEYNLFTTKREVPFMDEKDFLVDTSVKRGKGLLVATIVLLLLATLAVTLCVSMSASCMKFAFADEVGLDGLALIVLIPGMLIFAFVGLVLSGISWILASNVTKKYIGAEKIFGRIATVVSILYVSASVILPILTILLLQNQ